jgi:hypothetical protein
MHFIKDNRIVFQAKTGACTAAYLVGDTIPVEVFACLSSTTTLPLDYHLWHRRLCHSHLAGIKKLLSGNLVTGVKLDSQADLDPVCEACKAGKMHADPFPSLHFQPPNPSNPSTVMSMALLRCPHIKGIAIGSLSLMTSLASRLFTSLSRSLGPLLPSSSSKLGLRMSLE